MKIGLVGVGELGFAIGANMLEAGHELLVYDVRPQGIEEIMTRGALATSSAAEAAAAVQVVMTALPTPEIIDDVLLGSGGVLDAMQPGSVWIDHSTTDRDLLMKIEKQAREKDVDVIEAPVTGGIPLAHAGCITVLVGATASAFVRSRAL